MNNEKPPLGVMPQNIWKEKRIEELSRAIHEYIKDGRFDPALIWINELQKLVYEKLKEMNSGKELSKRIMESFHNPSTAL